MAVAVIVVGVPTVPPGVSTPEPLTVATPSLLELYVTEQPTELVKVFVNDTIVATDPMPQLIYGEQYDVKYGQEEFVVKCKSSTYGRVLRVEVYQGDKLLADNGKILKEKKTDR